MSCIKTRCSSNSDVYFYECMVTTATSVLGCCVYIIQTPGFYFLKCYLYSPYEYFLSVNFTDTKISFVKISIYESYYYLWFFWEFDQWYITIIVAYLPLTSPMWIVLVYNGLGVIHIFQVWIQFYYILFKLMIVSDLLI